MKKSYGKAAIGLSSLALLFFHAVCSAECPLKSQPGDIAVETAADCPWAEAARAMRDQSAAGGDLQKVFETYTPGLLKQLASDKANPAALALWGRSVNFDELAHGVIVSTDILNFLAVSLDAPKPDGLIMHAGLDHTYGYLFSVLQTKFGFKRARWVLPDINEGLGLPPGLISPAPPSGTLLANVTCLAGAIALKDDKAAAALLKKASAGCAAPLRKFKARGRVRITEEVSLEGGRKVALRTDLVPFKKASGGNSRLLVYSVYDSAAGQAYLVTAFPVAEGFAKGLTAPDGFGADKPVQTRYNAYVEGFTGVLKGRRTLGR